MTQTVYDFAVPCPSFGIRSHICATREQAEHLRESFFRSHPNVKAWWTAPVTQRAWDERFLDQPNVVDHRRNE